MDTVVAPAPDHHFTTSATQARTRGDDAVFLERSVAGGRVEVEMLLPFSWDAENRGVRTLRRRLEAGETLTLHTGGYGTADAVAALDGAGFDYPQERDGHRYVVHREPMPCDPHQDTAGWVVVAADDRVHVWAWEYSGAVRCTLQRRSDQLVVTAAIPGLDRDVVGPVVRELSMEGNVDDGVTALRHLIASKVEAPDLSGMPNADFPCLVMNSWGCQENTSEAKIIDLMDGAARFGAEVFVVDKGWEQHVGQWHANDRYPHGMAHLSRAARARGMGFGVWCGFGNADRESRVALEHPEWLSTWRGRPIRGSFDSLSLCVGHAPVEEWLDQELHRMVADFELTWLIHDFESISRCDSDQHSHPSGAGEWSAAQAWHRILTGLKRDFPQLVLENCWNGVRPLDLAMIQAHHTTITEDHCTSHWNLIAKHAMGRYLPLDWQSAYMGTEELPDRARLAPYVVGGPWIVMEDLAAWSDETWHWASLAAERYRTWRADWRYGTVTLPVECDREPGDFEVPLLDAAAPAIRGLEARGVSGRRYRVLQTPSGMTTLSVQVGDGVRLVDGWTMSELGRDVEWLDVPVHEAGDGLILMLEEL